MQTRKVWARVLGVETGVVIERIQLDEEPEKARSGAACARAPGGGADAARGRQDLTVAVLERLVHVAGWRVAVLPTQAGSVADAADARQRLMLSKEAVVRGLTQLVAAASILLLLGGFVTVWDGDSGDDVFVTRIDPSASIVLLVSALSVIACVVALRRPRALWAVAADALSAALLALAIRAVVVSDAADVNEFIDVEGGTGGISSPITRAVNGPVTYVDPDIISTAWLIAAALLIVAASHAGTSMWLRRRGRTHT